MIDAIRKIVEGNHLSEREARETMEAIMSGKATDAQIAAFITALRMKGETVDEITGFVKVMRDKAERITSKDHNVLDTCGTGGDALDTFNISTISAFVAAGAGIPVAKHGNRAVSSKCGSADLLQAIGINLDADISVVQECLNTIGIAFLFAPKMHQAMKYAISPRREVGIRTVFNLLGPLTNPARAKRQLIGVFSKDWTQPLAYVLKNLGTTRAMIVHGLDGLDEISNIGETQISELHDGIVQTYTVKPEDFGFQKRRAEDIAADSQDACITYANDILEGRDSPQLEIILLNAAAAIACAGKADTIGDGIEIARESIQSGAAREKVEALKKITNA